MAVTDFELSGAYKRTTAGPDLYWYCQPDGAAYPSPAAACAAVPEGVRRSRTVLVGGVGEMMWQDDTSDAGLLPKASSSGNAAPPPPIVFEEKTEVPVPASPASRVYTEEGERLFGAERRQGNTLTYLYNHPQSGTVFFD